MSLDLKDFRGKLTPRSWCVASAVAQVKGRDVAEVIREVIDAWAAEQIEIQSVANRLLRVEGLAAAERGRLGKDE